MMATKAVLRHAMETILRDGYTARDVASGARYPGALALLAGGAIGAVVLETLVADATRLTTPAEGTLRATPPLVARRSIANAMTNAA